MNTWTETDIEHFGDVVDTLYEVAKESELGGTAETLAEEMEGNARIENLVLGLLSNELTTEEKTRFLCSLLTLTKAGR